MNTFSTNIFIIYLLLSSIIGLGQKSVYINSNINYSYDYLSITKTDNSKTFYFNPININSYKFNREIRWTPSIIWQTKKGNFYEVELSRLRYKKDNNYILQGVSHSYRNYIFQINQRYHYQLFKKRNNKIHTNLSLAHSFGYGYYSFYNNTTSIPIGNLTKALLNSFDLDMAFSYQKKRFLVVFRTNFINLNSRIGYRVVDNFNSSDDNFRKLGIFDLVYRIQLPAIPTTGTMSLAYKI